MSAAIQIRINPGDLLRVEQLLRSIPAVVPKVVSRAVNRTLDGVKTDASREIRAVITASKKEVDATFSIRRSTAQDLSASFTSTGRALPLAAFTHGATARGVSVRIRKDRPRKVIPGTFVARMGTGYQGVFRRLWRGPKRHRNPRIAYGRLPRQYRLPMKELYSSGVPEILGNDDVMDKVLNKANERLHDRLEAETNYELSKL